MKEPKKAKLVRMGGMDQNRAVKELLDHPPDTILKAPPKVWKPEPIETVRKAQKWTAPPTSDEQAAMNMYSMDRYQQTNISLEREIAYDKQVVQDIIRMDETFMKSEITKPVVTHSAVGLWKLPPEESRIVGEPITIPSYQSTSVSPKVANRFMEDNRIMVEFRTPAGTGHAIQMDRFVNSPEEQEILLNRGRTYRIIEYVPKSSPKDPGRLVLEMMF